MKLTRCEFRLCHIEHVGHVAFLLWNLPCDRAVISAVDRFFLKVLKRENVIEWKSAAHTPHATWQRDQMKPQTYHGGSGHSRQKSNN